MTPSGNRAPCRLFVILAREASTGVIFRRGPSKWVQVIKWDTATDAFEPGQWFHGRIYEDRSDLSPDGTRLLYMATKYTHRDESIGSAWTAISKLPYLTALALFAHHSVTWGGGGLFISNDEVWINAEPAPGTNTFFTHKEHSVAGLKVTAYPSDRSALQRRRAGWRNHEKSHPGKRFKLRMQPGGFVIDDKRRGTQVPLDDAGWADWDQQGRLVFTREGKLFSGELTEAGEVCSHELADFNDNKPEPKETPYWATIW